ncbi:hypothetical protein [Streptomyces sp. P9-A2]
MTKSHVILTPIAKRVPVLLLVHPPRAVARPYDGVVRCAPAERTTR